MPSPDDIPYVGLLHYAATDVDRDNVPILGKAWRAYNAVIDFIEFGCYPSWQVWVTTLLPALGEAVLVLVSFGMDDVLRGYFRPNGLRSFSGLNRLPRRGANRAAGEVGEGAKLLDVPEFGEEIGKHLPGAEIVKGRKVTNVEMTLWEVDSIVQRGLYYWMIADITSDFIINWTTAIEQSQECQEQGTGYFAGHLTGIWPVFCEVEEAIGHIQVDEASPSSIWSGVAVEVPAGKTANLSITGTSENYVGGPITGGELWWRQSGTGAQFGRTGWPVGPQDDPKNVLGVVSVPGGHSYAPYGIIHGPLEGAWINVKLRASY